MQSVDPERGERERERVSKQREGGRGPNISVRFPSLMLLGDPSRLTFGIVVWYDRKQRSLEDVNWA